MNIAISIVDNTLYLVAGDSEGNKATFHKSRVKFIQPDKGQSGGFFWDQVDDEKLVDTLISANSVAITIPANIAFCKRVLINSELNKDQKDYQEWYAEKQLPGDISRYIYGFIPLIEDDPDENNIETLFYATISDRFWPLYFGLARDDIMDKINLIPEFMGLYYLLIQSVDPVRASQVGLVNFHDNGAAVVFSRDGAFSSARYFPVTSGGNEYLKFELEAYFLSLIDPESPMELFLTGREDLRLMRFKFDSTLKFSHLSAGFVAAVGALGYINSGGACELPAGI